MISVHTLDFAHTPVHPRVTIWYIKLHYCLVLNDIVFLHIPSAGSIRGFIILAFEWIELLNVPLHALRNKFEFQDKRRRAVPFVVPFVIVLAMNIVMVYQAAYLSMHLPPPSILEPRCSIGHHVATRSLVYNLLIQELANPHFHSLVNHPVSLGCQKVE